MGPNNNSLLILYATQTGKAEKLAYRMNKLAQSKDLKSELWNMFDFDETRLSYYKNLAVIVSTHGIGEPPFQAERLYKFLFSPKAPMLPELNYSVLALGDRKYSLFCQTGKDFDQILEKLGATRFTGRVDCDLDYERDALQWMKTVVGIINVK
ncbi:MAG: flavodoxin domain-containing protein [Cyclobacteriaceae bacterium]